ncbi:MAG: hypothetical protein APF77_06780 [Clostridia bacterium BRH_c25]|nr:MAG: hypothetical protein APF77_06780 [Clostridia bacterium BRH_c25]
MENSSVDPYIYPGDSIKYELDGELVSLYDKLRDLFFPDTDKYYSQLNTMPIFFQAAGQDSDCGLTADSFCKLIEGDLFKTMPDINRYLYLVDCQYLIGTIQNLISGMEDAFVNYYVKISDIKCSFQTEALNTTYFTMSQSVRNISSLLESYFVKAYSILDMFCKLAYEFENPMDDFSCYKKMKSSDVLWGERKKLKINGTNQTVFEKCDLISTIEALRNEVVHNGSWELNPKVFVVLNEGLEVERFMLFPDIEQGHLATVKNRRHFFGKGEKVNVILPQIHMKYMNRVLNTAKMLNRLKL